MSAYPRRSGLDVRTLSSSGCDPTATSAAIDRDALPSVRFLAVDHVVDVAGDARGLITVLTRRLCDRKHLVGEADKRHRDLHVARHVEPEPHVLRHPGLARLELAAHDDVHHAPERLR